MKIIIIILTLFIASSCFADVKLFRYTDKVTGEEMGVCYSDKDGNPKPDANLVATEISESQKDFYIKLQASQLASKPVPKTELQKLDERVKALETKVGI